MLSINPSPEVAATAATLAGNLTHHGISARAKPVELGELADRRYRIRAGLSAGQKIVVEGMERLSDGAAVAAHDWKSPEPVPAGPAR